jgi:nitronate monooxygenase
MLHTRLCDLLGITYPILTAPMGPDMNSPELVAAVSNAGGLGVLQAQLSPPPVLRETINRVRALTDKPFGVNFILQFPSEAGIAVCIEERVPVVSFFWGDPTPHLTGAHAAGIKVLLQVGSVAAAQQAARAGVDAVIAQGVEAGGHVAGEVATMALVPRVVDLIAPTPVIAAGGIADARGLVAALALGAEGVSIGTRFLATAESNAHPAYQQRLVAATEADTVRTILFGFGWPNAPHRTLRTPFVTEWLGKETRGQEARPDEPVVGHTRIAGHEMPVLRFMGMPPNRDSTGDIELRCLLAGQGVGLVQDIKPAATVVQELVAGAERLIEQRLVRIVGSAG